MSRVQHEITRHAKEQKNLPITRPRNNRDDGVCRQELQHIYYEYCKYSQGTHISKKFKDSYRALTERKVHQGRS